MSIFSDDISPRAVRKRLERMNDAFAERMRQVHPESEGVVAPDPSSRPARVAPAFVPDRLPLRGSSSDGEW